VGAQIRSKCQASRKDGPHADVAPPVGDQPVEATAWIGTEVARRTAIIRDAGINP
jgi:hypothetical protein